jgi:LuxR family transcriptional regulator, maltose regulon positive regulatory protein
VATTVALQEQTRINGAAREPVRRSELVERLIRTPVAALVIVVAPAGYGKSTLLSEWAEHDPRMFVPVEIDQCHADSEELTARLIIAALSKAGLIERATSAAMMSLVPLGAADVLSGAMQCIRARRSFVLAFDRAELLAPKVLREIVSPALQNLPRGSSVALASRSEPQLPLGRLRAHGELAELRMPDLAMTPAEAASLLRKEGVELEFHTVQELVRRTEGWPAALYLAALSLHEHPELTAHFERFGGDDHMLSEFLRDEVLDAIPPNLREFAVRGAVLEELSGPLCDEVLEQRGSAVALSSLARATELLMPLDSTHERFRWQRLFRDALGAELRRIEPDAETRLHLRASAWYVQRGDLDRAIDHAVASGDARLTGELMWANALSYVTRGHADKVECWLSRFSHDAIAGSPSLSLSAAYAALAAGKLDDARHWALSAGSGLDSRSQRQGVGSLATGLAAIDALVARTGAGMMREAATREYNIEPDESPWRPLLCLLRAVAEHLTGDHVAALALLEEGADLSGSAEPLVASLCLALSAMIAIEQGDWDLAEERTDRAHNMVEECGIATCPMVALVYAASAAARAHQDRADEAKRDLRRGVDLLESLSEFIPWYGADARVLLAHASLSLADVVSARALLAEASRLARRMPDAVIFEHWFNEAWGSMDTLAEASLAGPSSLTIAELRILRFLPSHRSFREIGLQLGVSANTVKTQALAVYRKLGAGSRSEAVARASDAGLIGR